MVNIWLLGKNKDQLGHLYSKLQPGDCSTLEKRAEPGECWQALQKPVLVYVVVEMGCVFNMSLCISVLRRVNKVSKGVGRV